MRLDSREVDLPDVGGQSGLREELGNGLLCRRLLPVERRDADERPRGFDKAVGVDGLTDAIPGQPRCSRKKAIVRS